ncbi:MAG: ribosome-associated translation inhibitor RaiA [Candidatus Omnitrophica bacterium]|nr:ribosome-associated translation inhibitor RaiA [Candidatus Omnitrophota bacterium]
MEVDITGRHFQITPALRDYATGKIQRLEKYSLKLESVHVIFEVEKFRHISEITVLGKGLRTKAKEESTDMYAAFDKSLGNLQVQLGRLHERSKDHKIHDGGTGHEIQS